MAAASTACRCELVAWRRRVLPLSAAGSRGWQGRLPVHPAAAAGAWPARAAAGHVARVPAGFPLPGGPRRSLPDAVQKTTRPPMTPRRPCNARAPGDGGQGCGGAGRRAAPARAHWHERAGGRRAGGDARGHQAGGGAQGDQGGSGSGRAGEVVRPWLWGCEAKGSTSLWAGRRAVADLAPARVGAEGVWRAGSGWDGVGWLSAPAAQERCLCTGQSRGLRGMMGDA
jgi:hypothetical protein